MKGKSGSSPRAAGSDYANRSVLVGAKLLRTIAKLGGGAGLQQVADASGMLPARTHRYLLSLVKCGLLDYDAIAARYDLGPLVLELGLTALGRIDAVRLGSDAIRRLSDRLDIVATLSVWGSGGATIVKCEMARHRLDRIREGISLPLLTSATGRIFFAYLPQEETRELLDKQTAVGVAAPLSDAERDTLRLEVQRQGIAANAGHTRRSALAAPIFNFEGRTVMVITIIADVGTRDMDVGGKAARALVAAAADLSRRLGAKIPQIRNVSAA
jgi:DNA-binding IclR family transcriptional regulator